MTPRMARRTLLRTAATAAVAAPLLAACDDQAPAPAPTPSPLGLTFPDGFTWGAATSAYQIEGAAAEDGKGPSIWDTFSHLPDTIVDHSTGDVACDHYHRWAADLDLLQSLGISSYRFSISWPRVLPTGRGPVNPKGLDFYKALVDGLHHRGITPMATLFHWDLPQALQDQGGWESRDCAAWFADYAATLFQALGDAVPTWLTVNEPKTIVQSGYTYGQMAPGKADRSAAATAAHHLALGHGLAVQAFRAAGTGGRIGPALNLAPAYPTSDDAADRAALVDGIENRFYLDPILRGAYPADTAAFLGSAPFAALTAANHDGDLAIIGSPIDVLGVNYYGPVTIDNAGNYVTVHPTSVASWEQLYPDGLHDLLTRLHRDYAGAPLVITENGIPDAEIVLDDTARLTYLRDHLAAAHRAIADGVPLEGYHVWSLLDNFEWAQGYTQRWGIVSVDFDTQVRTPKNSAHWYRDVIAGNAI